MKGHKNYTIKKYEKGGLVETKEYKDGKTVTKKEESYGETFMAGNRTTVDDPLAPIKLGGTTNVLKRVLGMDYKKLSDTKPHLGLNPTKDKAEPK